MKEEVSFIHHYFYLNSNIMISQNKVETRMDRYSHVKNISLVTRQSKISLLACSSQVFILDKI